MLPSCYKHELADYHFDLPNFPSGMKIIAKSILNKGYHAEENVEIKHRKTLFFQLYVQGIVYFLVAVSIVYGIKYFRCGFLGKNALENFWEGIDDQATAATFEEETKELERALFPASH